jgi:hypothetical protein
LLNRDGRDRVEDIVVRSQHKPRAAKTAVAGSDAAKNLPYRIELRVEAKPRLVERVLARASKLALARAIFRAAANEYPNRRVTLRQGAKILMDSAG